MCFPAGEYLTGPGDLLLGSIAGCPFYMDARQYQAWHPGQLVLDVAPGMPEGFSLAADAGLHFVTRTGAQPRPAGPQAPGGTLSSGPEATKEDLVMADASTVQVQAEARGAVPQEMVGFAVSRVGTLLRVAPEPVLFARVKLTIVADPAVRCRAITQVSVDLNGRLIRAQAAGRTMREAVEHACDRLRVRLDRAARNWEAIRGGRPVPGPGEWRHQSLPATRLPYYPRPAEKRSVMRRKSYTLARETPDEVVAEAELMEYDFHLFTEKTTGEDAAIYRIAGGYRLQLAHQRTDRLGPVDSSVTVNEAPPPRLSVSQAATWLEASGEPFLFFSDADTGRGNLLYHRYDGHYGLITPAG